RLSRRESLSWMNLIGACARGFVMMRSRLSSLSIKMWIVVMAAVLGSAMPASGQDIPPAAAPVPVTPASVPPLNGIAHIAVRVKDIAASVDFYHKLGFEQAFAMTKGDVTTQSFLKVNDKQFIELYPATERDP